MFKYKVGLWLIRIGNKILLEGARSDIQDKAFILDEDRVYPRGIELMKHSEGCLTSALHAKSMVRALINCHLRAQKRVESENAVCDEK